MPRVGPASLSRATTLPGLPRSFLRALRALLSPRALLRLGRVVHHPQLVAIQRRETARLLAAELPLIDRVSLEAETNRLADVYLLAFEREADRVIPSYDIEFE